MQHTEELAALLGEHSCISMGQDDKAHVPIGITAANKQAPLLMSLKYKVSLPDHDFVVATKHKLTPTVIGEFHISRYQCGTCKKIFTTLVLADKHIKLHGHEISLSCPVDEAVEDQEAVLELDLDNEDGAPIIQDLEMFLSNPE